MSDKAPVPPTATEMRIVASHLRTNIDPGPTWEQPFYRVQHWLVKEADKLDEAEPKTAEDDRADWVEVRRPQAFFVDYKGWRIEVIEETTAIGGHNSIDHGIGTFRFRSWKNGKHGRYKSGFASAEEAKKAVMDIIDEEENE